VLREEIDSDAGFYYRQQFKIYREPYLIWYKETWEAVLTTCTVYRIEIDGKWAGDVIWEDRGKETKNIVDFSILPEYQGKGIGKAVLDQVKKTYKRLTAVTRKETLGFFLECGFVLKKTIRNYYQPGVDGYAILFRREQDIKMVTLRKKIAEALEKEYLDLRGISHLLGIKEKEVLDHLAHIERSARSERFTLEPASCTDCGFSFRKRSRLSTPSRCPLCKSESISPPRFHLAQKGKGRSP